LDKLVVKPANESGGYGMLVGPHASQKEIKKFAGLIEKLGMDAPYTLDLRKTSRTEYNELRNKRIKNHNQWLDWGWVLNSFISQLVVLSY